MTKPWQQVIARDGFAELTRPLIGPGRFNVTHARTATAPHLIGRSSVLAAAVLAIAGCVGGASATRASAGSPTALSVVGAWRLLETASRPVSGADEWDVRPAPQGGLYVFSARHYSYFYVPGPARRARFVDGNRPTDAERAATFATFIAGAGMYTFDGRTLALRADFRKNPNEMTGEVWPWELDSVRGDTLQFIFREPPFLPGRVWRTTLVRAD